MDKELDIKLEQMYKDNEHKEIIEIIEAINESERDFETILHYGRALNNDGEYTKAKEELLAVEESGQNVATWNYRLGYAYYSLDDYEKCLDYSLRAIELDSKSIWAYVQTAQCYSDMDNLDDALVYINKAFELNSDDEEILAVKNYIIGRLWYRFALDFYKKFTEELNFNFDALSELEKEVVVMFLIEFLIYRVEKEDSDTYMLYQVIYYEYETAQSVYKELGAFETLKIIDKYYSIIKKYFETSVIEENNPNSIQKLSEEDKDELKILEEEYSDDNENIRVRAYRYYKNGLNLKP